MAQIADVSFTGTRRGMSRNQMNTVRNCFLHWRPDRLHNGLARGSDRHAGSIAYDLDVDIVGYPAIGFVDNLPFPVWMAQKPKPPLERNPDIVNAGRVLLATPAEFKEILRSGTWATIRYARRQDKPIVIVWPDGTYKEEGELET